MRVLENRDHWLSARQALELSGQRLQCALLLALRTEARQRMQFRSRQRQKISEQRHVLVPQRSAGEHGLELLPRRRVRIVTAEPRRVSELLDKRVKRTVLVIGRTEVAQPNIRLAAEPLLQRRRNARLADAGLAGDQDDLALARL